MVIPAQAGIQTSIFQRCLEITVISNLWIPACTGMTVQALPILSAISTNFRRPFRLFGQGYFLMGRYVQNIAQPVVEAVFLVDFGG